MNGRFIQIRGSMGSGKTSIARQFIARGNFDVDFVDVFGKKIPFTFDKSRNIIVTGRYDQNECGGCDACIHSKEVCREYLIKLMKKSPKILVFEGIMYGITFKFSNELNNLCNMLGYKYTAIALVAPFDVLIDRIYGRNGGKPIKVEKIEKQYTAYLRSTKKLEQEGVRVIYSHTQEYDRAGMYKILEEVLANE